jgi:hypothetical protein
VAVVLFKNGREGDLFGFILGFCTDDHLGEEPLAGDPTFDSITFPSTSPGAAVPCVKLQQLVAAGSCLVSINGLTAGDCLILPAAGGGTICVPMEQVGGVAVKVASADPVFTTLVGVAMDVTLCGGNGYWTRGPSNAQINMAGPVLLYHELVGHALHHCNGTFNAADPEGQAITDENVLRGLRGEPTRTSHEGGCGGGGGNCFVASAVYGSALAPEVSELRRFRDQVVRATPWGTAFFDEWWDYYYAFSPRITTEIEDDERFAELVRAVHLAPMLIGLRLFQILPDDPADPEQAITFARRAMEQYGTWIAELPLAAAHPTDDPVALADEIASALSLLPSAQLRRSGFTALRRAQVLPIDATDAERARCEERLRRAGLDHEELRLVFDTAADGHG